MEVCVVLCLWLIEYRNIHMYIFRWVSAHMRVQYRCSDGVDRHRQEWLSAGCHEDVSSPIPYPNAISDRYFVSESW